MRDKHRAHDGELSDSEDEGDSRRDRKSFRESQTDERGGSRLRNGTPAERAGSSGRGTRTGTPVNGAGKGKGKEVERRLEKETDYEAKGAMGDGEVGVEMVEAPTETESGLETTGGIGGEVVVGEARATQASTDAIAPTVAPKPATVEVPMPPTEMANVDCSVQVGQEGMEDGAVGDGGVKAMEIEPVTGA